MKKVLQKGLDAVNAMAEKALNEFVEKYSLVKERVNQLPVFVSSQKTDKYGEQKYDEKHYFVIPFMISDVKIALHSMRCLPDGVPEINALPKRRVFHFPNPHSEALVRQLLRESSKNLVQEQCAGEINSLTRLANEIDHMDKRLTYGMLVVGGMAAIANPLLGVGMATLLPKAMSMLSRHGLRPAGEKIDQAQLEKKVKEAEDQVLKEFEESSTIQVVNPILRELELALNTDESQHDPLLDFDLGKGDIPELDGERWRELTETAIYHVYAEVMDNPESHAQAQLGPEDIRWLQLIFSNIDIRERSRL